MLRTLLGLELYSRVKGMIEEEEREERKVGPGDGWWGILPVSLSCVQYELNFGANMFFRDVFKNIAPVTS